MVRHQRDNAIGVRRLGFGVSGPHGTPLVSSGHTVSMIRRAFHLGVRVFDTGPSYGAGEAERRLGEALAGLPRWECIVSTKAGIGSSGLTGRARDFSPDAVRRSIDASLKRLRLQRLDWLLLHGPAPEELTDALLKMLVEVRFSGQVGTLGIVGRGREIDAALSTGLFGVFMTPVHARLQPLELDRLTKLKATGAELVGIESLTTAMSQLPAPTSAGALYRSVRTLSGRTPREHRGRPIMTPANALAWALSHGGAHRVMVTTTNYRHLEANVAATRAAPSSRLIAAS